jgi:hypothetical protein
VSERPLIKGYFCNYEGQTPLTLYPDCASIDIVINILDSVDPLYVISNGTWGSPSTCVLNGTVSSQSSASAQLAIGNIDVHDSIIPSLLWPYTPIFSANATGSSPSFWTTFTINSTTGQIYSRLGVGLTNGITLTGVIQVNDSLNVTTCLVVFQDNPPVLPSPMSVSVYENITAGTIITSIVPTFASSLVSIDSNVVIGDSITFS